MTELRCVCLDIPLREVQRVARANGITELEPLLRLTDAGSGCGSCKPYIAWMLATGNVPTVDDVPLPPAPPSDG